MEIREVPEASPKCGTGKSSSQRSHSSSSRGSLKGARGSKKVDKGCLSQSCDEQRLPVHAVPVSPERPPRTFLKTSFGQRLSAQCGSIFHDNTTSNCQHLQRQESPSQAGRGPTAAASQFGSSSASEKNLRVTGNNSASGRGSSGISEVDVKGNNMVNAVAEVPTFRSGASNTNNQGLKLWGFPPGALPKQRAIAMVGQGLQAAGKFNINRQVDPSSSSRRDGSPLGHAQRASQGVAVFEGTSRDGIGVVPKVENEEHAGNLELQEAGREMIASASGRQVQKNSPASTSHFQQQQQIKSEGDCDGIELNDGGFNNRYSTDLPPLSVAADSEAPTANLSELGIGVAPNATTTTTNTTKRSSFKNDCGFLKLLPSKRKFSVEDQDQASPSPPQKPGYVMTAGDRNNNNNAACCIVESETHMMNAGLRLSSNSSSGNNNNVMGRKSLLVHFNEKPKSADVNTKDRRTSCSSDQLNGSNGGKQPVVGSFMKWMIDVGKGLAKKRCFGNEEAPPAQAATPQSITQVVSPLGSSPVTCPDQALQISKGTSRPPSPQSCQNMDCSEDQTAAMLLNAKSSASPPEDGCNGSEMHISGDELAQQRQQQQEDAGHGGDAHESSDDDDEELNQQSLGLPPDSKNQPQRPAEASNEGEGGNSQNATQGTTRSGERQKSPTTTTKQKKKNTSSRKDEKQEEQEEQEQSKVKQERALDLQQECSENVKSGGEASFGMWQASSCLLGSQERKAGATDFSGSKRQLPQQNVKNSRNNLPLYPPKDGSGDGECSQGMAEFVASMATVKNWVYNSFKYRETESSSNMNLHGGGGVSFSSTLNRPCSFCGLRGHAVADCSETLECELKELERRASVLEEMSTEIRDLPCLRCLGMGHLGAQCRFSVTEAASRARENSELRNWKFTRRSSSINDGLLWTQNSNIMAAPNNSATPGMIDRKAKSPSELHKQQQHSARERSKHEESPKENNHLNKKVGLNNQQQQQQQQQQKDSGSKPATPCKKKPVQQNEAVPPPVPKGMLAAVESVRLSRSELWRWVDSPDFNTHVRGFFLRLRFGRWEKDLGGTGYRMARIRGAIRKLGTDDKNMSVSVDLGDMECTVDSQYVSNHSFTEAELVEWWRGRWKAGKRLITEAELQTKLACRRQTW